MTGQPPISSKTSSPSLVFVGPIVYRPNFVFFLLLLLFLLLQTLSFYQFSATHNSLEQLRTAQSWSTLPSQQLTPSSSSREEVESNGEVLYKEVYHLQGQQILLRRCPFSTFIIIIWTTWLIVIHLFCTYWWNVYWRTWSFRACIFLIKLNFTSHWLCLDPLNP